MPRHAIDQACVPHQGGEGFACVGVPDDDAPVGGSRGQAVAIGMPRHTKDPVCVPHQDTELFPRLGVPDDAAAVPRSRGQAAAMGVPPEYTTIFERWQAVLTAVGAVSWEAESGDPLSVAVASEATPESPVVLHPIYAVPSLPAGLLGRLVASVSERSGGRGHQRPDVAGPAEAGSSAEVLRRVTLFDAPYIPGSSPHDASRKAAPPDARR